MQDILTYDCSPKRWTTRREFLQYSGAIFFFELTSFLVNDLSLSNRVSSDAMGGAPVEVKNEENVIEVPPIGHHDTVADWLLSLGLQNYLGLLIANGFDDIDFLVSSVYYSGDEFCETIYLNRLAIKRATALWTIPVC